MAISSEEVKMKSYGDYTVSKYGEVFRGNKRLKPWNNGRGYLILRVNGKTKAVHRLVAETYVPNPEGKKEVNHIDGNKLNNCYDNLEWCTRSENIEHAYKNGLRSALGERNANSFTKEKTVREICELISKGYSSASIRVMGYNYEVVRAIKSKKNWRQISKDYF